MMDVKKGGCGLPGLVRMLLHRQQEIVHYLACMMACQVVSDDTAAVDHLSSVEEGLNVQK